MRPVLFYLPGDVPVWSYGVMLGLSCVLGAQLAVYLARRDGIEEAKAWWFVVTVILCGIVGGRLHDLWVNDQLDWENVSKLSHSGRSAYGAYLSGALAGVLAARWLRVPFWPMVDAVGPTLALGLGITRCGCFLYGCDYGVVSERFGVCFPRNSPAFWDQHRTVGPDGAPLLPFDAQQTLPVLPTQLFEAAVGFALFGLLMWVWFRRPRRAGSTFLLFGVGYGLARAALEQIRADWGRGELLGLSTSTTIGLVTAALALAFLFVPWLVALRPEAGPVLAADAAPLGEQPAGAEAGRLAGKGEA